MSGLPEIPPQNASNDDAPHISHGLAFDPMDILDTFASPLIVVAGDGRVLYANVAAEQLFSTSNKVLQRMHLNTLISPKNVKSAIADGSWNSGNRIKESGVEAENHKGEALCVDIHIQPFGADGETFAVMLNECPSVNGISGDHLFSPSMRSIAGLAAVLAHEVKNPLSGIRGSAQLLEQNANDEDSRLTQIICDECDRIRALVDSMETFSDPLLLQTSPQNIHKIIDHVMVLANAGFTHKLLVERRYDPSLPPVLGDRDSLVQAFLNLIKNASEAMGDDNGRLILTTRYRHGTKIHDEQSNQVINAPIEITFADNGPGIPADLLDHIFEPFVSDKPGGKGLGLALVQKIISDHKGSITAENTSTGARFKVVLPEAREQKTRDYNEAHNQGERT